MTILVSSHILEELYQTATEFILLDHGNIIEEISDHELNERCKRHIAIQTTDIQKAVMVLEENLHTEHFKLMPDGTIRLYEHLDDLEMVASVSYTHLDVYKRQPYGIPDIVYWKSRKRHAWCIFKKNITK